MSARKKPAHVERAILTDNLEQLRVSGAAGARAANEVKKDKKEKRGAENEYYDEKRRLEEAERTSSANEHIVPIDDSVIGNSSTEPEYRHPDQQ